MNEAIKLAVEKGGLSKSYLGLAKYHPYKIVQDPLFWRALGKALGWNGRTHRHQQCMSCGADDLGDDELWQYQAKEYFHIVFTGGDTEAFFLRLLNKRQ